MDNGLLLRLRREIGRRRRLRRHEVEQVDFIADVNRRLSDLVVRTVFDVGANIGMTALQFSDAWPSSEVYGFEPSARNRALMERNLVGKPNIRKVACGLSDKKFTAELLYDVDHPTMSRLGSGAGERETIELDTLDNFALSHGIFQIDILKIDVEGHEKQVLLGADTMLKSAAISVIKAECAVDPDHSYHTPFETLTEILHPVGYRLFGLYEQSEDTLTPGPRLRRFDAAFIAPTMY